MELQKYTVRCKYLQTESKAIELILAQVASC